MADAIVSRLPAQESVKSFRVFVKRSDQKFSTPSPQLARELGARVWTARGWRVDLDHADLVISVEIIPGAAFCYMGRQLGPGGLPVGTGGRLVGLLSGGIDSPVAAWRMMRRGCQLTLVHFHSAPFLSNVSQQKARRLAQVLTRYQLRTKLYLVPSGAAGKHARVPATYRVVFAHDAAHRATHSGDAGRALVTGGRHGKVASQTLDI